MRKLTLCALLCLGVSSMQAAPLIVAHRGASAYAPENTVPSQQLAWDLGADGAEFDIYLTTDKKVMGLHDKTTSRTSGGATNLDILSATSAELEKIDVGLWKDAAFEGTPVPYLKDFFECHPAGKKLFIEIKDGPETARAVAEEVKKSGRPASEYVVISFNFDTCVEANRLMPDSDVYLLQGAQDKKTRKIVNFDSKVIKKAKDAGLDGVNLDYRGVTADFVKDCKAQGMKILVWTVDKPEDVKRMVSYGVQGITTNRPDTTRRTVNEALGNK